MKVAVLSVVLIGALVATVYADLVEFNGVMHEMTHANPKLMRRNVSLCVYHIQNT